MRFQANLESQPRVVKRNRRVSLLDSTAQAAMKSRDATITLMGITVDRPSVLYQLAASWREPVPLSSQVSALSPPECLCLVGEIRIEFYFESKSHRPLRKVREINVFMHAQSNRA